MQFNSTTISGLWEIVLERHCDERGSFARSFCRDEFAARGLVSEFVQSSTSVTKRAGTIRGMHFQRAPFAEVKLVRCVRGLIYDVVADLRPESASYMQWQAFELGQETDTSMYIPSGCAHGFQTLTSDAEVTYSMSVPFTPGNGDGFRPDDPAFAIKWPLQATLISPKDGSWPKLADAVFRDEIITLC